MEELENKNESEDEDFKGIPFSKTLVLLNNDEDKEIDDIARNSLCVIYKNDNNDKIGIGFFCEIPDPQNEDKNIVVLLTCNHVFPINKDDLNNYKYIKFNKINPKKKQSLCLEDGRRIWTNKEIDYTCIEIFPKKNICFFNKDFKIFKIEKQHLNSQNLKNETEIRAYTFIENNFDKLDGTFKSIEEKHRNSFKHNLKTKDGYSGSPIINKEDKSIIGIHMEKFDKIKPGGKGICINKIYNNMKENDPIKLNNKSSNFQKTKLYSCNIDKKSIIIFILIIIILALPLAFVLIQKIFNSGKESEIIKKPEEKEKEKEEEKEKEKETPKEPEYYKYFNYFFTENEKIYNYNNYYYNSYQINETGSYRICIYGAEANPGGKGGMVCAHHVHFEINDIIEYRLGGREAGGKRGENCGESKGKGYNGAGMALAKFKNNILIAGGGGGNSESNNKGGDVEEDGDGYFNGKGAYKNEYGKKGDEYAEDGSCNIEGGKGGKGGGEIKKAGKWCGGGGGDGYCGGGGGGWGDPKNAGGGGGGSNFCPYLDKRKCTFDINDDSKYSGIEIYIWK